MARLGRKLRLTPTTADDLSAAISIGATIEIACAYAGVSVDCYYLWMRKAKEALKLLEENPDTELTDNQQMYLKFYNKIDRAKGNAAIGWLQVIDSAASNDPNWARFMLKVRYPGCFDEVTKQQVDVQSGGQPIKAYTIIASPDAWPDDDD